MQTLLTARQQSQKVLSKLVAQAWLDGEFRQRFISNPVAVLEENGIAVPSGVQVRVNENASLEALNNVVDNLESNGVYEIPLPAHPAGLVAQKIQSWADGNVPVSDCRMSS